MEGTTLTETSEVVLRDGPMVTMIPLETPIDDHFVGLPVGALPGADPLVGGHRVDHPTVTSLMAYATA